MPYVSTFKGWPIRWFGDIGATRKEQQNIWLCIRDLGRLDEADLGAVILDRIRQIKADSNKRVTKVAKLVYLRNRVCLSGEEEYVFVNTLFNLLKEFEEKEGVFFEFKKWLSAGRWYDDVNWQEAYRLAFRKFYGSGYCVTFHYRGSGWWRVNVTNTKGKEASITGWTGRSFRERNFLSWALVTLNKLDGMEPLVEDNVFLLRAAVRDLLNYNLDLVQQGGVFAPGDTLDDYTDRVLAVVDLVVDRIKKELKS